MPARVTTASQVQAIQITEETPVNAMFHVTLLKGRIDPIHLKLSRGNAGSIKSVPINVEGQIFVHDQEQSQHLFCEV